MDKHPFLFLILIFTVDNAFSTICLAPNWSAWTSEDVSTCELHQIGSVRFGRRAVSRTSAGLTETKYNHCSNYTQIVGYSEIYGAGITHIDSSQWTLILPYEPFVVEADGMLKKWSYMASTKRLIKFQVLEKVAATKYRLMHSTEYVTPSDLEKWLDVFLDPPFFVKQGWVLGMKWSGGAVIKYSYASGPPHSYAIASQEFSPGDVITTGQTGYRIYKLKADIVTSVV